MEHYRDVRRMSMDENQMKEIEEMKTSRLIIPIQDDIQVLEGLEAVRRKDLVCNISSTSEKGLHHLVKLWITPLMRP